MVFQISSTWFINLYTNGWQLLPKEPATFRSSDNPLYLLQFPKLTGHLLLPKLF